jgi:transposase-like protein
MEEVTRPRKPRLKPPIVINHRKYWRQSETDAFKAALQAYALGKDPPPAPLAPPDDPLKPMKAVAREFGVTTRTIDRWVAEGRDADEVA